MCIQGEQEIVIYFVFEADVQGDHEIVTYLVFEAVMCIQGEHEIVTYFVFEAVMYRGSMRTSTAEAKPMQRAPESIQYNYNFNKF